MMQDWTSPRFTAAGDMRKLTKAWLRHKKSIPHRQALEVAMIPFVRKIAVKRARRFPNLDFDDLMAAGMDGVRGALDTFDPQAGASFSTYAHRAAQYKILSASRRQRKHEQLHERHADTRERPCEMERAEDAAIVHQAMTILSPRDAKILTMRICDGKGLQTIGDRWNLSKERIRQIESKCLNQLRMHLTMV